MTDEIVRVFPVDAAGSGAASGSVSADSLSDADLLALYSPADRNRRLVRANFIASIDGSATSSGLSGGLGAPADKRVFDLLRQLCDVVLVGAGTVRAEGYGAMRLAPDAVAWRRAERLAEHPVFALVSGRLDLDPSSDAFAMAPVRPLVLTVESAPVAARAALSRVADVIDCGATSVDVPRMLAALSARGLSQIHCEGGPSLLGALLAADALDALCLTTSPALEGGTGPRISRVDSPVALRAMRLDHVLLAGSLMLSKYSRER